MRNRSHGAFGMVFAMALAGPAIAQDAGGAWLKCDVTSRTTASGTSGSSFSLDHTAGYFRSTEARSCG